MRKYIFFFVLPLISFFAFAQLTGDQQNAIMGSQHQIDRVILDTKIHPNGQYTKARDWVGYWWQGSNVVPERPDGLMVNGVRKLKWPIIADTGGLPAVVWYYDGAFRSSNGYKWTTPKRWGYLRLVGEEWDPANQQNYIPGLDGPESAPSADDKPGVYMTDVQGQWMIDDLKRSFTVNKINKMLEASPYDEPDKGAPLE